MNNLPLALKINERPSYRRVVKQGLKVWFAKVSHNQHPGVGKGQPQLGAAAFVVLYTGLGRPFYYQVSIVSQVRWVD